MPIVTQFLCWSNTKDATRAVAMYGALLSSVFLFWYLHSITIKLGNKPVDEHHDTLYKVWFAMLFVYSVYFIDSCILMVGVEKGTRFLMINYLIYLILFELIDTAHISYLLLIYGTSNADVVIELIFYVFILAMNIPIFIIVLAEYQRTTLEKRAAAAEDKQQAIGNYDIEVDGATPSSQDDVDWLPYGQYAETGGLPGYNKKYPKAKSGGKKLDSNKEPVLSIDESFAAEGGAYNIGIQTDVEAVVPDVHVSPGRENERIAPAKKSSPPPPPPRQKPPPPSQQKHQQTVQSARPRTPPSPPPRSLPIKPSYN